MVAMRIRATDQLSGVVDQFSAVAEALLPVWDGATWTAPQATRHPAWAYCDVLRGAANARPVADERIDGDAFLAWAQARAGDTFDAVIDFPTTVFELLRDIAASGRAAFAMRDGKFSVVRDVAQTVPIRHFTPRNSTDFRGAQMFIDQPHALRVRFINPEREWSQDERVVYADGYTAGNATRFETLEMFGCTDADLAWRHARYHMAVGRLRPETFELSCDIDHLVCTVGDLVRVSHDVPLWGVASARVKSLAVNGDGDATSVVLDDRVAMESGKSYAVRFRLADGASVLASVLTQSGESATLAFQQPVPAASMPSAGDLALFGEATRESVELLVRSIRHSGDLRATLTMVDAAPAVHTADTGTIPAYDPQITTPAATVYSAPAAPIIAAVDSGTGALTIDASGQVQSRIAISLAPAAGSIVPAAHVQAQYRRDDSEEAWTSAPPAPADSRSLLVGPVDDGVAYTIRVRAVSVSGRASGWTSVAHTVVGKTEPPANVTGFVVSVLGDAAHLSWDAVADLDLSHYRVKFSPATVNAIWSNAIDLVARVAKPATSAVAPAMAGSYLIRAVDIGGRESAGATMIVITSNVIAGRNVVETVEEHPAFAGAKTDCVVDGGDLILDSDAGGVLPSGSYMFAGAIDLGAVYTSRVTGRLAVLGDNVDNLITHWARVADVESLSGAEPGQYAAWMELRSTDDDPAGTPVWSAWRPLVVGDITARAYQFCVQLRSTSTAVTPRVDEMSATVDMPDRTAGAHDVACPAGGVTVAFSPAFRAAPALAVSGQDMATGDVVEVTGQSAAGFTVQFKGSGGSGVARTFDWVALGYGYQTT